MQNVASKNNLKGLCGRCLSVFAHNPISPLTLYTVRFYNLITQGKGEGGRVEPERRLEGQQFTKVFRNTNMIDCISSL